VDKLMVFEPVPEKPGSSRPVRWKTPDELHKEIKGALQAKGLDDKFEYEIRLKDIPCVPLNVWRVVVFVTQGTSEGWYIHLAALLHTHTWLDLGFGKTFNRDFAWAVAKAIAEHFDL